MRKLIGVLALLVLAGQALFALDPEELNRVTFVNSTGVTIKGIFFSPGDSGEWGAEILGSERTLEPDGQVSFLLHYPETTGTFDIMAIDENDQPYSIPEYTFEDGREELVEFTASSVSDDRPAENFVELTIENGLDYDVYFLFLSPSDSDMWGADILDEESILSAGDTASFLVPLDQAVSYDVAAIDEDGDEYQFAVEMDPSTGDSFRAVIEASDYVE
jgi:hypothetical protein